MAHKTQGDAWRERRSVPEACAGCQQYAPPYVYMDDERHYCVRCAAIAVTMDGIYPAGRRESDLPINQMVWDELRLLRAEMRSSRARRQAA